MRILMANEEFGRGSGSGVYFIDTARLLAGRGHEVAFLTAAASPPGEAADLGPHHSAPDVLGFVHRSDAQALRPVREALSAFRPDVVYTHQVLNPHVIALFSQAEPIVRYAHGIRLTCPTGRRLPRTWDGICTKPFDVHCLWKAHTQLCMPRRPDTALKVWNDVRLNLKENRRAHKILVPSRYVRELLVNGGTDPGRVEVLIYYFALTSAMEGVRPASERRIVALGRLEAGKGFQHLIEALDLIEAPTTLEIVGEGPYQKELEAAAAKVPGRHRVELTPWVARDGLTAVYARARVVAVPSTWPEPLGLVGIEAMAHGLPTVGFDVGGIPDWLSDGKTGALVPRKDIPALARALDAYLSDPDLAFRHGAAGREEVRGRFRPELHINRLEEVLGEAAASPPR